MVNIPNSGVPITGALKIAKDWYRFLTEFKRDAESTAADFTPTLAFATVGTSTWSYSVQEGTYVKRGRLVWLAIRVTATPTIGTGSGDLQIGGLPFTPDARSVLTAVPTSSAFTWPASRTATIALATASTDYLILRGVGSGQAVSTFAASNMTSGSGHTIEIAGTYRTAS